MNIRPAIKEMTDIDLIVLQSSIAKSEDATDIEFRNEILHELKIRGDRGQNRGQK
jgi:hypothetical protein